MATVTDPILILIRKNKCLSDTFNNLNFCSFGSLICCICLCTLVSLCEEKIDNDRGEEEEEEEEETLAPDASSRQEQPAAITDVSASPLQHLEEVIHKYQRKFTKHLLCILFNQNEVLTLSSLYLFRALFLIYNPKCAVLKIALDIKAKIGMLLMQHGL